jgi:hypothetical protein
VGVLDRFEKGIERAVSGAFAKAFRSEVQPVEIASALRREIDDRAAAVDRDRTVAPNDFVVELGIADHQRLGEWEDALADELRAAVQRHASQQAYGFVGPVRVAFEEAEDLDTGLFRVRSSTTRGRRGRRASGAPSPAPAEGPVPGSGHARPPVPGPAQLTPPGSPAVPEPLPSVADVPPTRRVDPPAAAGVTTLEIDGRVHRLTRPVTVLGRSTEADIILDDPGVSRRHAEIHVLDGRARVVDLGSTNGTFVDGERVHTGNLADGSTVTLGRTRVVVRTGAR